MKWIERLKRTIEVTPVPEMTDECKFCGHLFEEHDWGAWKKMEAGCLAEKNSRLCSCENFE